MTGLFFTEKYSVRELFHSKTLHTSIFNDTSILSMKILDSSRFLLKNTQFLMSKLNFHYKYSRRVFFNEKHECLFYCYHRVIYKLFTKISTGG